MQAIIPQQFLEYARQLLGEERFSRFREALAETPSVSVRFHPLKMAGLQLAEIAGYDAPVPWSEKGVYLKERPSFTSDPLLHAGVYYVQEAASMFLEQAVRQYVTEPVVALDLCAAPGGKSTHLRSLLPEGSFLVSNEPIRNRAQVLLENMTKWGYPDGAVTNNYPKDMAPLHHIFDLIVTDVPCSGEGMFRKEEDAVTGWSMENVQMCSERQREIVADVWNALKPGGLLVYSTCTLNQYEDEENVKWIAEELGAEILPLQVCDEWKVLRTLTETDAFPSYHLLQGFTRGEGFFLSVLRKNEHEECKTASEKSRKKVGRRDAMVVPKECRRWLRNPDTYDFMVEGDSLFAVHKEQASLVTLLDSSLKVMQKGVPVAVLKGRDWLPTHALAMSLSLNRSAFVEHEVMYEEALAYLRKEALVLPVQVPKGIILLTYRGKPLGFVKNIGNRANNLYPQEWKVRSSHLPTYSILSVEPGNSV